MKAAIGSVEIDPMARGLFERLPVPSQESKTVTKNGTSKREATLSLTNALKNGTSAIVS